MKLCVTRSPFRCLRSTERALWIFPVKSQDHDSDGYCTHFWKKCLMILRGTPRNISRNVLGRCCNSRKKTCANSVKEGRTEGKRRRRMRWQNFVKNTTSVENLNSKSRLTGTSGSISSRTPQEG